jgi:hypothetical protein
VSSPHQQPREEEAAAPGEGIKHLAYAEASIMLLECLMLVLIEQRLLTKDQIVSAVESAIATKRQMVADHENQKIATVAAGVLRIIANSLTAAET